MMIAVMRSTMAFTRVVPLTLLCLVTITHTKAFLVQSSTTILYHNGRQTAISSTLFPRQRHLPPRSTTTRVAAAAASSSSSLSISVIPRNIMNVSTTLTALLWKEFREISHFQMGLLAATFFVGFLFGKCEPFWKRYTSVMDIPASMFGGQATVLRGRAITVSDGDTLRFLHAPTWFSPTSLRNGEKASEIGLPIRVCTIDTPETPKFGKSGQPFGLEAKENLKSLLDNRRVNVRLLQKDQYGRAVGEVFTGRWFFRKYVDEQMLKVGLAEVYQGGGAVYGPLGVEGYLEIEEEARTKKQGSWSQKNRESAAEYKKRTK